MHLFAVRMDTGAHFYVAAASASDAAFRLNRYDGSVTDVTRVGVDDGGGVFVRSEAAREPAAKPGPKEWIPSGDLGRVLRATSTRFGLKISHLKGRRRTSTIGRARLVYYYVARKKTRGSWRDIAGLIGRHYSSAVAGARRVTDNLPAYQPHVNDVIDLLENARKP